MYTETVPELQNILLNTAAGIKVWAESAWRGEVRGAHVFNWLGLAETAASRAVAAERPALALEWARLAVTVYDYLIEQKPDRRDTRLVAQMTMRAHLIKKLGPVSSDSVLDPVYITNWVQQALRNTPAETLKESRHLMQQLRELRAIKNRLNIISYLYEDNDAFTFNPELVEWLEIKDNLP